LVAVFDAVVRAWVREAALRVGVANSVDAATTEYKVMRAGVFRIEGTDV
jgi:hypothetical protein